MPDDTPRTSEMPRNIDSEALDRAVRQMARFSHALDLGLIAPDEYLAEINWQRQMLDLPPLAGLPWRWRE